MAVQSVQAWLKAAVDLTGGYVMSPGEIKNVETSPLHEQNLVASGALTVTSGVLVPPNDPTDAVIVADAAPFTPGRTRLRDFRSAKDYGATGNGSTDDTSALLTATEEARNGGRSLYVPPGTYKTSGSITNQGNSNPLTIHGDGPGVTEFTMAAGMSVPVIIATGVLAAGTAVTAPVAAGSYLVDVASTAGITPGMWIRLIDTTQPVYGLSTRSAVSCASEFVRVYSVVSSTRLRLHSRLDFAYTTSAIARPLTTAVKVDARQFSIRNLAPGTLASTARGIQGTYWADFRIRDVDFTDMDGNGVSLARGVDALVEGVHFLNMRDVESANTPYGISASSCQDVEIQHVRSRYGRHLYTAGGDATYGVASHVHLGDCIANEHSATGFDTHPGAIKHVFENCHVHGSFPTATDQAITYETSGFQIRGSDTDVVDCTVDNVPDSGVYFVYGADRGRVIGGRFAACDTGVKIEDSDDCLIGGNALIQSPRTDGVAFVRNAPYAAAMLKATLGDLRITGNPSGAGIHNFVSGLAIDYL